MANINDYLKWRGDIPLSKDFPFNEVDSMILARFSYLRFDKIKRNKTETIASLSEKMKDFAEEEFLYHGDKELITLLGSSKRFQNLIVTDYIKMNDKEAEKQFGAITIHLSEDEMYLSFLGTDATVYGWKEDFNMAFMESVPCQINGKNYVKDLAEKYQKKRIRIGGHSKGGNVAIYSAITASEELQNRIMKVYNYDGPGFQKSIIAKYKNSSILEKIVTYLPQDSMIGRIMNHEETCEIAFSTEKGIYQHDIYSWQVLGTDLIHSENVTENSEVFRKTIADWIEGTTVEQRKAFFDGVFELIYATDANTFADISSHLSSNMMTIFKAYQGIAEQDRKAITEMLKLFIKTYFGAMKKQETMKMEDKKEHYKLESKKKIEEFDEKHFCKLKRKKSEKL